MSMAPKSNRSSESPETVAGTRVSSEQQPLLVQAPSSSTASSFNLPQEHPQKPSTRAGEPPPYIDIEWNGDRVQCVKTTDDDTLGDGENLGSVAFEVGKDLVVLTGLASKFPATVTYLVAKTLHEIPRLYGDSTARDFGNITDTLSGMAAAGQVGFQYVSFHREATSIPATNKGSVLVPRHLRRRHRHILATSHWCSKGRCAWLPERILFRNWRSRFQAS